MSTYNLHGLKADGILGLAPSSQGTKSSMVLDELYNQGLLSKRIFSVMIG